MAARVDPRGRRLRAPVAFALCVVLAGAALTVVALARSGEASLARPRSHTIEIRGFAFQPSRLEVAVGDTVVWVNRDFAPHTATARDTAWDTGLIAADSSGEWVVREAGTQPYYCIYHPSMTGTIVARVAESAEFP